MNNDLVFTIKGHVIQITRPQGFETANEKFSHGLRDLHKLDLLLIDVGVNQDVVLLAVAWGEKNDQVLGDFVAHLLERNIQNRVMSQEFKNPKWGYSYGTRTVISIIDPESVVLFKLSF